MLKDKTYTLVTTTDNRNVIVEDLDRTISMEDAGYSMRGIAYTSLEELYKEEEILADPCKKCGTLVKANWLEPSRSEILASNLCFSCNLWSKRAAVKDTKNHIVVNGSWYTISEETSNSYFRGYGGAKFTIKRGEETIVSTNLWCGGDVPDIWRSEIPDNAQFIR
jgi:hypothetical protein